MALQVSNGFKSLILGPNSFESIFNGGVISVYTGTRPNFAEDPIPPLAPLLGRFTLNGLPWQNGLPTNGLIWVRDGSQVLKSPNALWQMTPVANGLATWFRITGPQFDDGDLNFDAPRIDGTISPESALGTDMRLLNPVIAVGQPVRLDYFLFTLPPITGF